MYSILQAKNRDIAKVITANKVSASDLTYISNLNAECLRIFRESYKEFALNGDVTGKAKKQQTEHIKKLENALSQVESENSAFKTRIEMLRKEVKAVKNSVNEKSEKVDRLADIMQIIINESEEIPEETKGKFRKMLEQKYYTKTTEKQ